LLHSKNIIGSKIKIKSFNKFSQKVKSSHALPRAFFSVKNYSTLQNKTKTTITRRRGEVC